MNEIVFVLANLVVFASVLARVTLGARFAIRVALILGTAAATVAAVLLPVSAWTEVAS